MTGNNLDNAIVQKLQEMAISGEQVPALLRYIQQAVRKNNCQLLALMYFRAAFDAGVAALSPAAGWCGFGVELSDIQVQAFLLPVLEDFRRRELADHII